MSGTNKSRQNLLNKIKSEGKMSFDDIWEFQRQPETYFGPGVNAFDILFAISDLGRLRINFAKKQVEVVTPPEYRR